MNWNNFKIYTSLTLVSLFYGINYSVLKTIVPEYLEPFGFIVIRVISASIIFWLFYFFNQEKIDWKIDGLKLVLCSLTGVAVNQLLFYKGISLTSAVNGSIIMTLTPVLVLVWAALILGEKITKRKITGVVLGLIGAIIIVYEPDLMASSGNWRGDALVLLNGSSYALYLVLVKPLMKKYKPMTVVTWIFTIGIILVSPVGITEVTQIDYTALPAKVWFGAAYAIIMVTVVVYFLNAWTLARVNSSVVGAFIYVQPIFATMTAVFFFDEKLLLKHLVASAFVFAGVWMVTKRK